MGFDGLFYYRHGANLERRELSRKSIDGNDSPVTFSELDVDMERRSEFAMSNVIQFFSSVRAASTKDTCHCFSVQPKTKSCIGTSYQYACPDHWIVTHKLARGISQEYLEH